MRDRAAYMRAYRAKHRSPPSPSVEAANLSQCQERVTYLEGEVARLKRELAERQTQRETVVRRDPFREYRPVPKPSRK